MNGVRRAFTGERAWHDCRREARALREALFPEARKNENGFLISFDADEDLAAALYDLKRLNADKVCIRTIERVLNRLRTARSILQEN